MRGFWKMRVEADTFLQEGGSSRYISYATMTSVSVNLTETFLETPVFCIVMP